LSVLGRGVHPKEKKEVKTKIEIKYWGKLLEVFG
jgi:hypothetical protein